jgi:hypothetical protein
MVNRRSSHLPETSVEQRWARRVGCDVLEQSFIPRLNPPQPLREGRGLTAHQYQM